MKGPASIKRARPMVDAQRSGLNPDRQRSDSLPPTPVAVPGATEPGRKIPVVGQRGFSVDARERADGRIDVVLTGELDLAAARRLADALDALPLTGDVLVDATALQHIDTSGLAALMAANERLAPHGRFAVLVGASPTRTAFEASGVGEVLDIDPSPT
jgi:anti-anti-sigma factor